MAEQFDKTVPLPIHDVKRKELFVPGNICVARYWRDGKWYRGQIVEIATHDKVLSLVSILCFI